VRWAPLAVWVVLGCEARYGAYLEISGPSELDTVELYFGKPIDSSGPGAANQYASPRAGVQSGVLFDRKFASFDRFTVEPTTSTTYYVPPDGVNEILGAYVVAVASRDSVPVGIAEYFGFEVPSREVHVYELPLVPYDPVAVERWGVQPGCIAWKRDRGDPDHQVVAVVHENDRDCDHLATAGDCNDLCTIGSPSCDIAQTLCFSPCAAGCVVDGACRPTMCLPSLACTVCPPSGLSDRYQCLLDTVPVHLEIVVETDTGAMCSRSYRFELPPGVDGPSPCLDPQIEAQNVPAGSGISFSIATDTMQPGGCVITATQDPSTPFDVKYHLLVSLAAPDSAQPRRSVVIGIAPGADVTCSQPGYFIELYGSIYDCQ
jgi:hypothetical protein